MTDKASSSYHKAGGDNDEFIMRNIREHDLILMSFEQLEIMSQEKKILVEDIKRIPGDLA